MGNNFFKKTANRKLQVMILIAEIILSNSTCSHIEGAFKHNVIN